MKKIAFLLLTAFGCVNTTYAVQNIKMKDGATATVIFSEKEMTRIAAKGSIPLNIWTVEGQMDSAQDEVTGDWFVTPVNPNNKTFSFFVQDESGSTMTIIANLQDVPSETIIFEGAKLRSQYDEMNMGGDNSDSRKAIIRNMMRAMANNDEKSYLVTDIKERVPLWREVDLVSVKAYETSKFIGTVYILKNISNQTMNLGEEEFIDFGPSVVAVGLSNNQVKPQDTTYLYVIRRSVN
ncbi:TPA: type-F conjugative transfer system secretin TraK [Acinetobacter baumannii]|uniref:Conjugal transfer protein TraK n=7 Tax=Acinetobacter baumannii TaxID=470 RepID=A0A646LUN2_ACIBA|nr:MULTISPECIES: type-F conjugative transfer system secretin TraK [Acinetobacter calcoaceticus/baumannii complex]EHU3033121.1 type-F conjugative transfer system secretin TraK [Acinetobacter baumannii]EHZ7961876.1 type-F conjugative transfer system secretin TraK [Acinetobacter baumannii]EIB7144027.1 type-F conjugative transfer system secretin TraK [Acinetobacter baumannii]EKA71940.1 putative type-F conjugative transfer system secretin TraK [Acinetobacter baumannii IS-58]EKK06243.1 putative type